MTAWTWSITPGLSGPRELTAARARKFTARLDTPAEASFTIDGRHEEAVEIEELVTDLHIRREGVRLYRGRVGATSDDVTAAGHQVQVSTGDYRALLNRRILYDNSTLTYTTTDQAAIALGLVNDTQVRSAGDLGITAGEGATTGVTRTIDYQPGSSIGEAIQQLSKLTDGFDWEIDPDTSKLNIWYPQRGTDKSTGSSAVLLDLGGLVSGISRQVDPTTYGNALRFSGADGLLAAEDRTAADIASRREGRWDIQRGDTSIIDALTLDARADYEIEQVQDIRPTYTVTMRPDRWEGPTHIWLGDTVRLVARSGRLDVDTSIRVYEVSIDLSDEGAETVQLTLGAARQPSTRQILAGHAFQLNQLARR